MDEDYILFFTATILDWKPLLKSDDRKTIIMDSLKFLASNKRIFLYGFVIMPNHIHLLWRMQENHALKDVQRDFLKFTAQQIKFQIIDSDALKLAPYKKEAKDRQYQFWQRNSYNKRIYNRTVFEQKLDYIHANPLQQKWKLAKYPEDYFFSSAKYYIDNIDEWGFITHYHDHI